MGRVLGLDVGSKTIGVAVSDEFGWTAQGLTTLARTGREADVAAVRRLVEAWGAERVVVGLPRNMDGSIGPAARAVLEFAEALGAALPVPVVTWDERLTTAAATRTLLEAGLSRRRRRRVVDTLAATFILQGYLDRQAALRAEAERPADEPD
ncbi:MAG TPA: Holliday junction resolvase RuvX [Thermodesulfobacteriota bacterium]|nr:Holliday junction resolvase RuvX [Thermodesulfobacteriota bacterium]